MHQSLLSLFMGLAAATNAFANPSCAKYLTGPLGLADLLPARGPGLAGLFPAVILPRPQVLARLRQDRLARHVQIARLVPCGAVCRRESARFVMSRADLTHEQTLQPHLRDVRIELHHLDDFVANPYRPTFTSFEPPIRILPREWQKQLLTRLLESADLVVSLQDLNLALMESDRTSFALNDNVLGTSGPALRCGRDLSPLDPKLAELLEAMVRHYFGDTSTIDEARLREVFHRHVRFRIVDRSRE